MKRPASTIETLVGVSNPLGPRRSSGNVAAGALVSPSRSRMVLSYSVRVSRRSGRDPTVSEAGVAGLLVGLPAAGLSTVGDPVVGLPAVGLCAEAGFAAFA
jgi:hypothetical protein